MKHSTKILYCEACGRKTVHASTFSRTAIILTFCTFGLFALVWPACHYFTKHWTCQRCGHGRTPLKTARRPF